MWLVWTAVCGAVLSLAGVFLYLNPQIPTAETYRHVRIETPLRILPKAVSDKPSLANAESFRRRSPMLRCSSALLDTKTSTRTAASTSFRWWRFDQAVGEPRDQVRRQHDHDAAREGISFSPEQTFIRKFKEMLR
jgi:hypothetical protein